MDDTRDAVEWINTVYDVHEFKLLRSETSSSAWHVMAELSSEQISCGKLAYNIFFLETVKILHFVSDVKETKAFEN